MKRLLFLVPAVLLAAGAGLAQTESNPVVEPRAKFETYLKDIGDDADKSRVDADGEYERALVAIRQRLQAAAQLDGVLAVNAEIERFERAQTVTLNDMVETPPELATVQQQYRQRLTEITRKKNEDIVKLARVYAGHLKSSEEAETRAGRTEAALRYRAERDRVLQLPAVTAADFELAAVEPVVPEETPVEAPTEPAHPPVKEPGPAPAPAAPAPGSSTALKVYADGQRPPATPDLSFRRLPLRRTDNSPLGNAVVLTATSATTEQNRRAGVRFERVDSAWYLRVMLRSSPAIGNIDHPTVVAEFFTKDAAPSGRIEPIRHAVRHAQLEHLSPESTTIAYDPIKTSLMRQRPRAGTPWRYGGKEFYGAIISVFDADGKLVCQDATVSRLNDVASTTMPEAREVNTEKLAVLKQHMDNTLVRRDAARRRVAENPNNEAAVKEFLAAEQAYNAARTVYEQLRQSLQREL